LEAAAPAEWGNPAASRLPWPTVLAFLRITTKRRVYEQPLRIDEALAIVGSWLGRPCVSVLEAGEACWEILREMLVSAQASGPLVMDAFLAAPARENGATLVTSDRDFTRFEGLKRRYPTATSGG
jgi:toxin-antitoxin system PIN domain toxin